MTELTISDVIQTGDILVFKGKSLASTTVKWATGSPYTHTAIAISSDVIADIDWNKSFNTREMYDDECIVLRHKEMTNEKQLALFQIVFNMKQSNITYDWWRIFAFLLNEAFPAIRMDDKSKYICTEMTDYILSYIGITVFPNHFGHIYPHEFVRNEDLIPVARVKDKQVIESW